MNKELEKILKEIPRPKKKLLDVPVIEEAKIQEDEIVTDDSITLGEVQEEITHDSDDSDEEITDG